MAKMLERWTVLPHGPLEEIDRILTVSGEIPLPLGNFPRRMTVVGLRHHRTAIYSAIALDEPEMARIEALGRPSVLIVPGDSHRMDARIWKRYSQIKVLAPPGTDDAVEQVVHVDAHADSLDDPDITYTVATGVEGHEAALLVRRLSGSTLIVDDLIGHVVHPHGIGALWRVCLVSASPNRKYRARRLNPISGASSSRMAI